VTIIYGLFEQILNLA